MKQKWLLTSNLRDDEPADAAFGVQVTGTAVSATGSIWVEYHIEFCSPRAPTKPVTTSVLSAPAAGSATVQTNQSGNDVLMHVNSPSFIATQGISAITTLSGFELNPIGEFVQNASGITQQLYELVSTIASPSHWATLSGITLTGIAGSITVGTSVTMLMQQLGLKRKQNPAK